MAAATLAFLTFLIVVLLVERSFAEKRWASERRDMIDAFVAKNAGELRVLRHEEPKVRTEREPALDGFQNQYGI